VTTEDDTARVEEAAEQIDGDEDDQNDGDYNTSDGACSESFVSTSSNFGSNYKEIKRCKTLPSPIEKGQ